MGVAETREETLNKLGVKPTYVVPRMRVEEGIQAVRAILPRCWFDHKTELALEALAAYRNELDEKQGVYKLNPIHDWSSHYADAFRYLALGLKRAISQPTRQATVLSEYDPFGADYGLW